MCVRLEHVSKINSDAHYDWTAKELEIPKDFDHRAAVACVTPTLYGSFVKKVKKETLDETMVAIEDLFNFTADVQEMHLKILK